MKALITSLITASLVLASTLRADDKIEAKLAKFPKAAAEALKKAAGTATIERASIEKDGKTTVYEAEYVEKGKPNRELSVTADGKTNAEEVTVPLETVPARAKVAIEKGLMKGETIQRVQHIKRADGSVTYEALYVKKGKEREVEYLEDGSVKPE